MFKPHACDKCDRPTDNKPNEFDEVNCDACEKEIGLRGFKRFCEDFGFGEDFLTIRRQS
jgi:hypothetical protein